MKHGIKTETTRKSSEGRLRKSGDLTTLQNEAANAVNEAEDEPVVNDEEKYEAMIESRKFRRAVSWQYLNSSRFKGECLYDFLERQVKD